MVTAFDVAPTARQFSTSSDLAFLFIEVGLEPYGLVNNNFILANLACNSDANLSSFCL